MKYFVEDVTPGTLLHKTLKSSGFKWSITLLVTHVVIEHELCSVYGIVHATQADLFGIEVSKRHVGPERIFTAPTYDELTWTIVCTQ